MAGLTRQQLEDQRAADLSQLCSRRDLSSAAYEAKRRHIDHAYAGRLDMLARSAGSVTETAVSQMQCNQNRDGNSTLSIVPIPLIPVYPDMQVPCMARSA
jgi:hypothetical protein